MKNSLMRGFSFGLTSGIITTLGLMVGLYFGTHYWWVVLGGVLSIAIADACSDSLGIYVSEKASGNLSAKSLWRVTVITFFAKFIFALTFAIPILLFPLKIAILVCVLWGTLLMGVFSVYLARLQKRDVVRMVLEHIVIMIIVLIITSSVGFWISKNFV